MIEQSRMIVNNTGENIYIYGPNKANICRAHIVNKCLKFIASQINVIWKKIKQIIVT